MKLSQTDKLLIYVNALGAILRREKWPTSTPPNKQGESKPANKQFAVATWAASVTRAAVYVLEKEDEPDGSGGDVSGAGGQPGDTPF